MGEFEAIGDAVTGGLIGRAVEPKAGEAGRTAIRTRRTASIAAARLAGDFCHACGQKAHVHRTLRAFVHDLLHGAAALRRQDLADPADAGVEAGRADPPLYRRRAGAFVSPVALFLFTVFLMFAVMNLTGALDTAEAARSFQDVLARKLPKREDKVAELEAERDRGIARRSADRATRRGLPSAGGIRLRSSVAQQRQSSGPRSASIRRRDAGLDARLRRRGQRESRTAVLQGQDQRL